LWPAPITTASYVCPAARICPVYPTAVAGNGVCGD
jgi:hypothetical protein